MALKMLEAVFALEFELEQWTGWCWSRIILQKTDQ
jgi:hypothetical protein